MNKHLHIISLTVPYPVDYGGVYDLFYKLPALQTQGVHIHLHCFDYGRGRQAELEKYCVSVQYYPRLKGIKLLMGKLPYIVASRKNESLFNNLLQDDYPILMEGIHCTALFTDDRFTGRQKFVRLHNVECDYYNSLYASAKTPASKLHYLRESQLLKKYEAFIAKRATRIFTVTQHDADIYHSRFGSKTAEYLPLFLPPHWQVNALPGMGSYCLYHGDLSVEMNEKAALWLLKKIFSVLKIPLVIAGKNPSERLKKLSHANRHTCIVENPTADMMQDMIAKAHINILPSFSNTGIKIKLLNALYNGRHCIVTPPTVEGSGLEELCHITRSDESMILRIEALYHQPFTEQEARCRAAILNNMFNNNTNAQTMVGKIWSEPVAD